MSLPAGSITIYGVATPYAWDVVESARRAGLEPQCVDNHGGADPRLPALSGAPGPSGPFVLGLSAATHRAAGAHRAFADGLHDPVALLDPTAVVASSATVGHGCYVNAGSVVASHVRLGCHVNVNRSVSIGHDNVVGFAASFGPGAITTGGVQVGAAAFIGAGATVLPGVRIGRRATVGAGAVVTRDVADFEVVVGNPARATGPTKHLEPVEEDRCPNC
jgi:sugar O-acyltransferase (sialic acid O-acetyltransferase NeuD family)